MLRKSIKNGAPKYSVALDEAARAANCQNYRHALRTLPLSGRGVAEPYVLLTAYWWEHEDGYRSGRETLAVKLSRPILEIGRKSLWRRIRELIGFRMVAADHFVSDGLYRSQDGARTGLCAAARAVGFVELTGLRPVTGSDDRHLGRYLRLEKLPGADHSTVWVDSQTDQFVVIDEPYSPGPDHYARADWAIRTGWTVAKTDWAGIYSPYACDLYVVTDGRNGYNVGALVGRINAMPPPLLAAEWTGDSVLSWETFVSPLATTPQDLRRARCRGMIYPADSATSVPYDYQMGTRKRRPIGEMGIRGHIEAGNIIRAVLSARHRGLYMHLSSLRSTLEDWMSLEMAPGDVAGPEFFDVYYNDSQTHAQYDEIASTRAGAVMLLDRLKQQLLATYSECAPLKRQLRRIEMSMDLLRRDVPHK